MWPWASRRHLYPTRLPYGWPTSAVTLTFQYEPTTIRETPLYNASTLLLFLDQFITTFHRKSGRSIGVIVAANSIPRFRTWPEFTTFWVYPVDAEIETGR